MPSTLSLLTPVADQKPEVAELIQISRVLEGLPRHASTHAAGVVIGDRPLDALVPLYKDPRSDMPATQFNMKWVEQAGLVKFDFLGLKTLTVIQNAVDLIHGEGRDTLLKVKGVADPDADFLVRATYKALSKNTNPYKLFRDPEVVEEGEELQDRWRRLNRE